MKIKGPPPFIRDALVAITNRAELSEVFRKDLFALLEQTYFSAQEESTRVERQAAPETAPVSDAASIGLETLCELGKGTTAKIHRVRDPKLKRTMALKSLHSDPAPTPPSIARFVREAQITAQLQHPGIVSVHELGRYPDGRYYFTMDEVKGRELEDAIREVHEASSNGTWHPGPSGWNFRRLIDVFHRVCKTVGFAHDLGVIHRDLKPSNVMVGDYGEVLVVDWGLAKVLGESQRRGGESDVEPVVINQEDDPTQTLTGPMVGTLAYMAPEQARGELEKVGPATDVFSLGAVLYQILAGRPHIEARSRQAAMRDLLLKPLVPPGRPIWEDGSAPEVDESERDPSVLPVPGELQQICLRAMESEPAKRYPDGGALAAEVGAWLEGVQRREKALSVVEQAKARLPKVVELKAGATKRRERAAQLLESVAAHAPIAEKRPGWILEEEAAELERRAEVEEVEIVQMAQGALIHDPHLTAARDLLASFYREKHVEAEAARDDRAAARFEALLKASDTGRHRTYIKGDGAFSLVTDPPGARASLFRFVLRDRRLEPEFYRDLGATPLKSVVLPTGSYLLKLKASGRAEVLYPLRIGREEHWDGVRPGDRDPYPIYLPKTDELGPDDVYVPAGIFQSGGDPVSSHNAPPGRRVWLDGFVIRRFPVTNSEYIRFLDDLVAQGREEEALAYAPRERAILSTKDTLVYGRAPDGRFSLRPDADGHMWQDDWAIILVDWRCASAYAAWLRQKTGRPWRLPAELEWEKAARGTDGRFYPWGDFVDATWCCLTDSHKGRKLPPSVYDYPLDSSPYGIRGLAGGYVDWCQDFFNKSGPAVAVDGIGLVEGIDDGMTNPGDEVLHTVKGGAWSFFVASARATRRQGFVTTGRAHATSFRMATHFPFSSD